MIEIEINWNLVSKLGKIRTNHLMLSYVMFISEPYIKYKQGLHRTWKLQRCTNWKVNLQICQATFVLFTFVHTTNISAVSAGQHPLTQNFVRSNFFFLFRGVRFLDPQHFWTHDSFEEFAGPKIFLIYFFYQNFVRP